MSEMSCKKPVTPARKARARQELGMLGVLVACGALLLGLVATATRMFGEGAGLAVFVAVGAAECLAALAWAYARSSREDRRSMLLALAALAGLAAAVALLVTAVLWLGRLMVPWASVPAWLAALVRSMLEAEGKPIRAEVSAAVLGGYTLLSAALATMFGWMLFMTARVLLVTACQALVAPVSEE